MSSKGSTKTHKKGLNFSPKDVSRYSPERPATGGKKIPTKRGVGGLRGLSGIIDIFGW